MLDEPTNHLDIRYQHEVLGLVAGLARDLDTTTVVVLHDLNLAARYCDDLVLLGSGGSLTSGSVEDVLHPDVLEPVYGIGIERSAEVLRSAGFADVRVEELRSVLELDRRHSVAPGHEVQLQYLITGRRPVGG